MWQKQRELQLKLILDCGDKDFTKHAKVVDHNDDDNGNDDDGDDEV